MLKMFQQQISAGGTPEYWDTSWERGVTDRVPGDSSCENTALYPLFMQKLRSDRLFLEGGCGPGHWVKYFHDRGYRVVGVDFAPRAVDRLHRLLPGADVRVGDIMRLPFADGEVHTYYSGGVVEHAEAGPEPALAEARRVLAPDGWFLCSVPDASSLRNLLFRKESTERRDASPPMIVKRVEDTIGEPPPDGMHFFQYAFTEPEFTERLTNAGFEVTAHFGYALVWGLLEIPGVSRLSGILQRRHATAEATGSAPASPPVDDGGGRPFEAPLRAGKEFLKRALLREDRTTPVLGPAIGWANEHMANMRMYVARPRTRVG
jgi:SAM-dependent methyltransferase